MGFLRSTALAIGLSFIVGVSLAAAASPSYSYTFESAAIFYAQLNHRPRPIDPEVFVSAPGQPAGTDLEGIVHVEGYRPAMPGPDPAAAPLFSADGRFLGMNLGMWTSASGSGRISCEGGRAIMVNHLRGLIPGGVYQLERLRLTSQGVVRLPLGKPDGSDSTFLAADGETTVSRTLPFCPSPSEVIAVAFHSDAGTHGAAMGQPGVNLHEQLIARLNPNAPLPPTGGPPGILAVGLGAALIVVGLVARLAARRGR